MAAAEVRDVAPGLWIWRAQHPAWQEGLDWEPLVTSTVVESREEIALIDALAPPQRKALRQLLQATPQAQRAALRLEFLRMTPEQRAARLRTSPAG